MSTTPITLDQALKELKEFLSKPYTNESLQQVALNSPAYCAAWRAFR